ncbi:pentatricopeptide repeat-containing protein [Quercus suber]|uniref:Pentatricopeptide repeat-containing protein n=1 Tax=Quercus suber TaxID=58331 RepID=A0AAW0JDD6_QUESU
MEKEVGNCSPNVVTYTSVTQSFFEKGQTMEALEILDIMEAFGCAPNCVTELEAEKFNRNMLATGVKPDSLACSILIRELCLEGRVLDVGLCQQSHLVEAAKLARLMLKKGISLKASYVDSTAEHLKKFENEELVKQLSMIEK